MMKRTVYTLFLLGMLLLCSITVGAVDTATWHETTQNIVLHADGGNTDIIMPEVTLMITSKEDGSIADIRQFPVNDDGGFTYKFKFKGNIQDYNLIVRDGETPITKDVEITAVEAVTTMQLALTLDHNGLYIAEDEKGYAEAVIENTYGDSEPYLIIIAAYDSNNALIKVAMSNRTTDYQPQSYKSVLDVPVPQNAAKVKAFIWDTEMRPITGNEVKELTDYIELPNILSDNMLVQAEKPIEIFGNASFVGQEIQAKVLDGENVLSKNSAEVKQDGTFDIALPELVSGGPYEIVISAGNIEKKIKNVMVGELWLCSGQSNMELRVSEMADVHRLPVMPDKEITDMRIFIASGMSDGLNEDVNGSWQVVDPTTVLNFSAVGWCAMDELHDQLNVPVGGILAAHGGTAMAAWVGIDNEMGLKSGDWYNTLIHPFTKMNLRGVLWYQGEDSEDRNGLTYNTYNRFTNKFANMIHSWEKAWGYEELPFMFVQLPAYPGDFSKARLGQLDTYHTLDYTGLAVSIDCLPNSATDKKGAVHPSDKEDVGRRLAYNALSVVYGKDILSTGPLFDSIVFENGKAIITFDHVGDGLKTTDGEAPRYFNIAGSDGVYYPATASIINKNQIEVSSASVAEPAYVRYFCEIDDGYYESSMGDNYPVVNLTDSAGIPAGTFYSNPKVKPVR